jgi:hypothetical protein
MGFSRKRTGRDGKPRYTAYYLDIRGQERSAGTFSNRKDANDAWKKAEVAVSALAAASCASMPADTSARPSGGPGDRSCMLSVRPLSWDMPVINRNSSGLPGREAGPGSPCQQTRCAQPVCTGPACIQTGPVRAHAPSGYGTILDVN